MITYFNGTIFNSPAQTYVNTVNCLGVMGAGVALEFSLRYPDMFNDYKQKCDAKLIKTGIMDYYIHNQNTLIVNFPTKHHFKYPSQIPWIEQGLKNFVSTYKEYNIKSIAFPKLGCGHGGLDWDIIKPLMEKYLSNLEIDTYICLDTLQCAEGKEADMLKIFNNMNIEQMKTITKLTTNQTESILKNRPYRRFFEISKTKSIGITTYSKLFNYCYTSNPSEQIEQLKLF